MMALASQVFSTSQINSCFPFLSSSIPVNIGLEQQCDSGTPFNELIGTELESVGWNVWQILIGFLARGRMPD